MAGLPPLKSLQAFDAAARHLSFKRAAKELNLTPTAISHRIRALETHLGCKLFHRLTRSLQLTPEGKAYAPGIRQGFQALRGAATALQDREASGELVVTATMSFATNWLGPRLHRFSGRHPDVSVRLLTTDEPLDFGRHGIDVAIRYGKGNYQDRFVAWILSDIAIPVCAPSLLKRADSLTPGEIRQMPLIQYEWNGFQPTDPGWAQWFDMAELSAPPVTRTSIFSDEHMCLQAAMDGRGVALVGLLSAARDIEAGRLVLAHPHHLTSKSCFLTCADEYADQPKFVAFREWLLEEADRFRDSKVGALLEPSP